MNGNPLNIIAVEGTTNPPKKASRREETQALMDRLWLEDPEQFNPLRNCLERERLQRTLDLIQKHVACSSKLAADLGCAGGEMSRRIRDLGANIHSLDIAGNALKKLKEGDMRAITPFQDCLPTTKLADDHYDLIVSTDVIAFLKSEDYRLYMSELARLVKTDGWVVCSTPLDINTEEALQKFAQLAETEFEIKDWVFSYHRCYLRLRNFWRAPSNFIKASQDPGILKRELQKRRGIGKFWFKLNSTPVLAFFWKGIDLIIRPINNLIEQNRWLLLKLEKLCRFLWSESGISHALFIGKRRPLTFPLPANEIPVERKEKRHVWE